ncbi:MAG: UbiX family flavin prenyltransferase [Methermicoccaceae archaeon]
MEVVVGITGASGVDIGARLLDVLSKGGHTTHLVLSDAAADILGFESDVQVATLKKMASRCWDNSQLYAPIASGSHRTDAMVVVPCSMKSLSSIANGYSDTLISRAADVCLKERRTLVLVPRETPLSYVHLENMVKATRAGACILPACPAYYTRPTTVEECIDFIVGRVLDVLAIPHELYKRWSPPSELLDELP